MVTSSYLVMPGKPPQTLNRIWGDLSDLERSALLPHLTGDTSADWLVGLLARHGYQISATTIRAYRRSLRNE